MVGLTLKLVVSPLWPGTVLGGLRSHSKEASTRKTWEAGWSNGRVYLSGDDALALLIAASLNAWRPL